MQSKENKKEFLSLEEMWHQYCVTSLRAIKFVTANTRQRPVTVVYKQNDPLYEICFVQSLALVH